MAITQARTRQRFSPINRKGRAPSFNITLKPELLQRLDTLATEERRSRTVTIEILLEEALASHGAYAGTPGSPGVNDGSIAPGPLSHQPT